MLFQVLLEHPKKETVKKIFFSLKFWRRQTAQLNQVGHSIGGEISISGSTGGHGE
jgi:hypothetical protein